MMAGEHMAMDPGKRLNASTHGYAAGGTAERKCFAIDNVPASNLRRGRIV